MRNRLERLRPWLPVAGVVLAAMVLLPPGGSAARQYVFAQAVQFAVLAVVVPALVVLGAPWRFSLARAARAGNARLTETRLTETRVTKTRMTETRMTESRPDGQRLAGRVAIARSHRVSGARPWLVLVGFIAIALTWRLPVAVNALVRYPLLTIAEAVTLVAAGCALWIELADSPPLLPRISRPQRAAFAAVAMWTIWASAYIMGFSRTAWFTALAHAPGHGLGTVADQEIAAGLLWAIAGLCFVPAVYVSLITWLRDSADPDDELRSVAETPVSDGPALPRPPRGWRLPSV